MLIVHIHQEIVLDLEKGGFSAVVFLIGGLPFSGKILRLLK